MNCLICTTPLFTAAALYLGRRVRSIVTRNARNAGRAPDSTRATRRSPLLVKRKTKVEERERAVARGRGRRGGRESGRGRNTEREHDTRSPRHTQRLHDIMKVLLMSRQPVTQRRKMGGGKEKGEGGERGGATVMREDLELHGNSHSLRGDIIALLRRPVKLKGRRRERRRGGKRIVKEGH